MADITMCVGEVAEYDTTVICKRRANCYRYTASENEYRQAWFMTSPLVVGFDNEQSCDYFSKVS